MLNRFMLYFYRGDKMTLGQRLYEMRRQKGFSQEQVAEVLGVTRQTVSKWETDQTTPDFDKILPLCELYNISTDELLKGEQQRENAQYNTENSNTYYYDTARYDTPVNDPEPTAEEKELYEKGRKKSALIMSGAICLYILSVIPFFISDNEKNYAAYFLRHHCSGNHDDCFCRTFKTKGNQKKCSANKG